MLGFDLDAAQGELLGKLEELKVRRPATLLRHRARGRHPRRRPPRGAERARARAQRVVEEVNQQFRDPELTTFVCVCIPEFLSLYETERLVQELARFEIDASAIVINQARPPRRLPHAACAGAPDGERASACERPRVPQVIYEEEDAGQSRLLAARARMQQKYLAQFDDLYEDFHLARPRAWRPPCPSGADRMDGEEKSRRGGAGAAAAAGGGGARRGRAARVLAQPGAAVPARARRQATRRCAALCCRQ